MNRPETISGTGSKARLRLWLAVLKAARRIEGRVRERLRHEHGTTLPRFDVMAALDRNPAGLRMSELSGALRVSNGNITGIVERLVGDGLVERRPVAGDRRAMQVRLTGRGRETLASLAAAHERWIDDLLAGIEIGEAGSLAAALGAMVGRIEEGAE